MLKYQRQPSSPLLVSLSSFACPLVSTTLLKLFSALLTRYCKDFHSATPTLMTCSLPAHQNSINSTSVQSLLVYRTTASSSTPLSLSLELSIWSFWDTMSSPLALSHSRAKPRLSVTFPCLPPGAIYVSFLG